MSLVKTVYLLISYTNKQYGLFLYKDLKGVRRFFGGGRGGSRKLNKEKDKVQVSNSNFDIFHHHLIV